MKHAIAMVTRYVLQSPLKTWLEERCRREGIELEYQSVSEQCGKYAENYKTHANVITWNCKMPHKWMQRWGRNVLYVENSLLAQRAGMFTDTGGFFSQSNLCRLQTWRNGHPADAAVDVEGFARRHFKWKAFSGGTATGPVLVCLQCGRDSNVRYEFPLAEKEEDKVAAMLKLLFKHLPRGRPVVVRPHPREKELFLGNLEAHRRAGRWREEWQVDGEGSFSSVLPGCSALVTVNSTCASEALTLGLPVATLGTGAFTGSGATLECGADAGLLSGLFDFKPDLDRCRAYTAAILGRHFLPYQGCTEGTMNEELRLWLERAAQG